MKLKGVVHFMSLDGSQMDLCWFKPKSNNGRELGNFIALRETVKHEKILLLLYTVSGLV